MTSGEIIKKLDYHMPDAILAVECSDDSFTLFETLHQRYAEELRPTLIYCVEEPPDERFDTTGGCHPAAVSPPFLRAPD